jgi:hypothetical protein
MRVLEQVGRFFAHQAVGVFVGGGLHATYEYDKLIQNELKGKHRTTSARMDHPRIASFGVPSRRAGRNSERNTTPLQICIVSATLPR